MISFVDPKMRLISPTTEVRVSPTKPCGKGSKRKQDDLEEDDDEEGEEHQSWVESLTQELVDEGSEKDPDYEVCLCCRFLILFD